jgi:GTP diphosphokinase / guanosine-3',5'-bis(diphosphate) 3'-diphosphatase
VSTLAYRAMILARDLHKDQRRKYTGNPYVDHLAEVAGIVAAAGISEPTEFWTENARDIAIATAWLHDCVEDQGIEAKDLIPSFGETVANAVWLLSDLETEGNRATRKEASRARLATAPGWVQSIKCADLISNTSSIVQHDPEFAKVYLAEKQLLLTVLTKAHPGLHAMAWAMAQGV